MSESEDDGAGQREVAYRLFAAEFDDSDYSYSESDEERAPNYVITPTGARVNRLFVVGVLTEVEQVGEDVLRARVVDPTGAFVLYAGQYQPDEQAFLDRAEPPMFVAVTGKARTFQPEDSSQVYTSIRPESISTVDADTRDRWTVQTAEQTLQRISHMATALSLDVPEEELAETLEEHGIEESLAEGIPLALDHYGTTPTYLSALREMALAATRVVTDEVDEVESLSMAPDVEGDVRPETLTETAIEPSTVETDSTESEPQEAETTPESTAIETDTSDTAAAVDTEQTETVSSVTESTDSASSTETSQTDSAVDDGDSTVESTTGTVEATRIDTSDEPDDTIESGATTETTDTDTEGDDIGDFEPGEFELDDDEREEIEEEYGTEFQSGTEVEEPGEVDIDTPDPEEMAETESAEESQPVESTTVASETESGESEVSASEPESDPQPVSETEDQESQTSDEDEDIDVEETVVDVMTELDDGNGAARSEIVEAIAERHGTDTAEIEDAIQSALMGGRCYEPDDDTLKPI